MLLADTKRVRQQHRAMHFPTSNGFRILPVTSFRLRTIAPPDSPSQTINNSTNNDNNNNDNNNNNNDINNNNDDNNDTTTTTTTTNNNDNNNNIQLC